MLYTIRNKVGGGQSNQFLILKDELYSYAKEAFQNTDETHARLMELATEEKVIMSTKGRFHKDLKLGVKPFYALSWTFVKLF